MLLHYILIAAGLLSHYCGAKLIIPPAIVQPYAPIEKRLSSNPFISGDSFRLIADHTFDELRTPFDPDAVKEGDSIFVNGYYFEYFYQNIHPLIHNPYKIICHNSDLSIPTNSSKAILEEPSLIALFTQNPSCFHKKLIGIPIGLANKHWPHGNTQLISEVQSMNLQKKHLLYSNFLIRTYPTERTLVHNLFKDRHFCYSAANKGTREYLIDLKESHFVLCPRGNGLDCHRIWETLLVDSYPIVKSSSLDQLFNGLPVLIVNEWQDITEDLLHQTLINFSHTDYAFGKMYITFWTNLIKN